MHTGRPSVRSIIANISFQASFKGGDTGVSFRRVWTLYSLSWNSDFLLVAPFASQVNFPRCLAVWGQDLEQGPRYNVGGWFWRLFSPFLYRHTGEDKQEEHGSGLFLSVLWSNISCRYSYLSYMHRIQCLYSFNWGNFSLKPSKLDTNLRHKPSLKNKDFPLDSIWTSSEMVCQ